MADAAQFSAVAPEIAAQVQSKVRRDRRAAFNREVDKAGIANAQRHFVEGHPVDVILKLARRQRTAIAVMGAISRSGIQRLVLGNVAEQVLDALPCDVLVVKPASFKARVGRKTRGAQLIPTPPYV
jgi:universal stress protein E